MTDKATHTPLPCPFCGSPAEIEEGSDHHGTWFNLGCSRHWGHVRNPDHTNTCIAGRIYYTETDVPLSEALTAWNTRAVNSHLDLIEALREIGELTKRRQLPLTNEINDIVLKALKAEAGHG